KRVPVQFIVGCPGTFILKEVTSMFNSKSKSNNLAPTLPISILFLGKLTAPSCPLKVPVGLGISLILNLAASLTLVPSGNVPVTLMVTSLPAPGFITYFPTPFPFDNPGADADTLLSDTPAKDMVIGLVTPR